jgi:hypothetical protein
LDSGALLSSGSAQLHATSAGFELLARLYRESSAASAEGDAPPIRFVTTAAVLAELRDEKTRAMMAALPFQIEVLSVNPDAIREGQPWTEHKRESCTSLDTHSTSRTLAHLSSVVLLFRLSLSQCTALHS